MAQINLNATAAFLRDLKRLMKLRNLRHKSEAIRLAVQEAVGRSAPAEPVDFSSWIGLGLAAPSNAKRRFRNEDELWNDDDR